MASIQTVGVIDAIWQGTKIPLEKGATFNPGGYKNNTVIAGRQVFRSQEVVPSKLEGTTVLQKGQTFTAMFPETEGELQVICDTGQIFIVPDAFRLDVPDVTGGDGGKVKVTWNGSAAQEMS
jgi:hypothetical protein